MRFGVAAFLGTIGLLGGTLKLTEAWRPLEMEGWQAGGERALPLATRPLKPTGGQGAYPRFEVQSFSTQ